MEVRVEGTAQDRRMFHLLFGFHAEITPQSQLTGKQKCWVLTSYLELLGTESRGHKLLARASSTGSEAAVLEVGSWNRAL